MSARGTKEREPMQQLRVVQQKKSRKHQIYALEPQVTEELVTRITAPGGRAAIEKLYALHAPSKANGHGPRSAVNTLLSRHRNGQRYQLRPETHRIWMAIYRGDAPPESDPVPSTRGAVEPQQSVAIDKERSDPIAAAVDGFREMMAQQQAAQAQAQQAQAEMFSRLLTAISESKTEAKAEQKAAPFEPSVRQFHELSPMMQRAILNTMHNRYADVLKQQGMADRPFAAAWHLSYGVFSRETGVDIEAMASEESDATGKRIRPLDIIERRGEMAKFRDIIIRAWG